MKKVTEQSDFIPSAAFKTSIGFFVRAEVTLTSGHIGYAWEPDGYEVIFTGNPKALEDVRGTVIDIPGHAILNYSGAQGPWAPGRVDASRRS